jgi:hypothetical protein
MYWERRQMMLITHIHQIIAKIHGKSHWRYFRIFFVIFVLNIAMTGCATQPDDKQSAPINSANEAQRNVVTQNRLSQSQMARDQLTQTQLTRTQLDQVEEKWGIQVVALRSTMAGMMIDFRYKVLDAEKAAPLLDLNTKAYLLVERNGAKLDVPSSQKIGALRQTMHPKKIKEGFDYFVLFGNPGSKYAKPGDKVAVVIGDFKAENLVIQ